MSELTWQQQTLTPTNQIIIHTDINSQDIAELEDLVEAVAVKAISYFDENVKNESRFLYTQVDLENHEISLLVTDESMANDSDIVVTARFMDLPEGLNFQLLIHESLATALMMSVEFMNYSLLAVYSTSSRQEYQLV